MFSLTEDMIRSKIFKKEVAHMEKYILEYEETHKRTFASVDKDDNY